MSRLSFLKNETAPNYRACGARQGDNDTSTGLTLWATGQVDFWVRHRLLNGPPVEVVYKPAESTVYLFTKPGITVKTEEVR